MSFTEAEKHISLTSSDVLIPYKPVSDAKLIICKSQHGVSETVNAREQNNIVLYFATSLPSKMFPPMVHKIPSAKKYTFSGFIISGITAHLKT